MSMNSSKYLFLTTLVMGTMITVSSSNWLGVWMGLEINLISFVPLISKSNYTSTSEAMMIYFLTQALGSATLLMMIVIDNLSMISTIEMNNYMKLIMAASTMLKSGLAPFHFWFPEVANKLSWTNCMILMTWQKIAPLVILSHLIESMTTIYTIAMASTTVGAIGGLNQTSLRKIMAYSSISHLGWMVACMKMDNNLWAWYLLIYSMIVIMVMTTFSKTSMFYMNQINMNTMTISEKLMYITLFMSLGGLPPFLGFLPKWIVIQSLMMNSLYMVMTVMVLTTLITLFYYLRMMSTLMIMNTSMSKWTMSHKTPQNFLVLSVMIINMSTPVVAILPFF
uniref:NADH-ubiquinone oxidoreductase chain 2 n=1 Tax=Diplonychus rusticus TaxID=575839 RepID=C5HIH2_9HEMI|nr:NADH dehydrogenase subunit 2 [Diplonychus rusticus]